MKENGLPHVNTDAPMPKCKPPKKEFEAPMFGKFTFLAGYIEWGVLGATKNGLYFNTNTGQWADGFEPGFPDCYNADGTLKDGFKR